MSADLYLEGAVTDDDYRFNLNVTYNLSPMLAECGWVWREMQQASEGHPAAVLGEPALAVLARLEADPEHFRGMNPPNGWGDYDDLVRSWRDLVAAIEKWPDSKVHYWL